MASPKRLSSSVDGDVIKKGCLIKSPPANQIHKQFTWKRRLFKLCKSPENIYTLCYYKYDGIKEKLKGTIFISDITDIKDGSQLKELDLPLRVCGCTSAQNILLLKTKRRDFFFVDENKEEIEDWRRCLIEACKHMNQVRVEQLISFPRPVVNYASIRGRSQTDPVLSNEISSHTSVKTEQASIRGRSQTDPVLSNEISSHTSVKTEQKTLVPIYAIPEPDYDVPHSPPVMQRYSSSSNSSGLQETSDTESEKSVNNQRINCKRTESVDHIKFEKKEISVLTEHLKRYLRIEEIGERLCVAQWKGPREIGCLFRHGDHIDAINNFWLNDLKLFYLLLDKSVQKEVQLSVISNRKANIFHNEGCPCVRV